ncbi:MAG: alpha-amylase family glycosyl hydrolase, partial [Anaerolineales bacterium]
SMAVGEVFGTAEEIGQFYGGDALDGLHLAFNFQFIHRDGGAAFTPWDAETIRDIVCATEADLPSGSQPCYALGNHDRSRFLSRHDHDGLGPQRAGAAALLLLGLRNTPFVYYGEEIGMVDVDIPEGQLQDPARIHTVGRDPERTPMQWDASAGRGFSTGAPWLPYGHSSVSVAAQLADRDSLLSLYRRAIWRRRSLPALLRGHLRDAAAKDGVFSFVRAPEVGQDVLVAVNTATEVRRVDLPAAGVVVVATDGRLEGVRATAVEVPPLGAMWAVLD